jgi:hypothetical protein
MKITHNIGKPNKISIIIIDKKKRLSLLPNQPKRRHSQNFRKIRAFKS